MKRLQQEQRRRVLAEMRRTPRARQADGDEDDGHAGILGYPCGRPAGERRVFAGPSAPRRPRRRGQSRTNWRIPWQICRKRVSSARASNRVTCSAAERRRGDSMARPCIPDSQPASSIPSGTIGLLNIVRRAAPPCGSRRRGRGRGVGDVGPIASCTTHPAGYGTRFERLRSRPVRVYRQVDGPEIQRPPQQRHPARRRLPRPRRDDGRVYARASSAVSWWLHCSSM